MTDQLMYAPAVSYADSSFFVELSALKLDVLKLDTSFQDIVAYYNYSALGTEQPPSLNVSDSSFKGDSYLAKQLPPQSFFLSRGKLFNVNSIEEFKNVNKKDLLTESALSIWNKIKDGSFTKDPSILSSFILLSYADLKKYKFYYWFAFPQLQSEWVQIKTSPNVQFNVRDRLFEQQFYVISSDSDDSLLPLTSLFDQDKSFLKILFIDTCSYENTTAYILRNFFSALAYYNFHKVEVQVVKHSQPSLSFTTCLENANYNSTELTDPQYLPPVSGWEKTSRGKLGPKLANLGSLIDPLQLADQAIDLNLKLMKWRLVPQLNLQLVKDSRVLILGSGTLGSYTARCLLAWGVRKITFVDNGKVSFSNPVRQPLFNYADCLDGGSPKAETAAANLKRIFPLVNATGFTLEVPMIGHSVKDEVKERADFEQLEKLVDEHDAIFLLLDSREARWLPTVLGNSKNKIVINAALGFESYLVMRHGCVDPTKSLSEQSSGRLGCYFCNDIVAPTDSTSDRTLDQMCTVTRPGVALMASSLATELFVSVLQTPERQYSKHVAVDRSNILGSLPHQLRGFLHNFELLKVSSNNFKCCTACSIPVIQAFNDEGWEFVKRSLNESTYLEDLTGLKKFHEEAERAALIMEDLDDLDLEDEEIV
ncbi:hypothetical protein PICMEDRAFT_70106 [Pichia membranifaciens NRRL Y-2026]|uniref:Ubiquitin-like modifier-activating enzyme ATG7 n=1 Tax=Pichia membranifaciens NRRL Y-2026 TaxID=763406 RepID=A0A1E3NSB7_9ASCO|nr:hypothetical protein PICMEDRAFT_70106 [Pichia membranifaciens NRRL Y-2026]ODQ48473.1 hypothetical protein PICMEDRAFT_70106 [Pichia membranifaciens NRRL Y-2026]